MLINLRVLAINHIFIQEQQYHLYFFLIISTDMQAKVLKTTQQKTLDFFKTVQAGDISLFELFEQAIAIFGFTKVGKTSSCHILSNSPLRAEKQNGDLIYRPATQKYNTATVGLSSESQTEIPNIFETKFKNSKGEFKSIVLLDQPGYGDTYGFHRIFSNGYFHYRTFSKTPKLKFVLAFKKVELEGTGEKFKATIENFINAFSRYGVIKKDILAATAFLITQAEPKSSKDNIKSMIERLRDQGVTSMSTDQKNNYQQMVNNILGKDKIFVIEKPEHEGNQTKDCDILKQIYEKTTFWVRDVKQNVVDMSEINFSVAADILNQLFSFKKGKALFKEQFNHFMKYMQDRIDKILLNHQFSLKNIVNILKIDAVSDVGACNFLQGMNKFVQTFYKFNEQYRTKREKTEANLFNLAELNQSSQLGKSGMINNDLVQNEREERQKQMRQVYFIKKFKVLEFLKERADKINNEETVKRSVEWLQSISSFFIELFKRFNYLRVQKSDSERIIYKYSYVVQRLIEQSKIITLILFSNQEARKKFDEHKQMMVDIYRPLNDQLFAEFGNITVIDLKNSFIEKLNFDNFQIVNKDIIDFFESVRIFNVNEKILLKIAKLVVKYADIITDKRRNIKDEEKRFVAFKLFEYRNLFYNYYGNIINDGTKNETENCIENIFSLSNALGNLLSGLGLYEEARDVFKSTNNAELVFKIFQVELKVVQKDAEKTRLILIEYGKYAGYCHREELAVKCFQEAYAKSKKYHEFKEASDQIIQLKKPKQKSLEDPYLQKFYGQEFCSPFSENLKTKISILYSQNKVVPHY